MHQKVDRYNMYIRRVHAYCYYCSEEFFDPEDLFFRCGELHLRGTEKNHGDQDATAWYDNVDSKFRQRLETPDDPTTYGGQKMIDRFKDEYATERTVRVEEGKYRCALCDKLFKGPEFVKKHIIAPVKADHVQIPEEVVMKAIDEQYYENYLSDPKRILPSNINFTKENEKQAQRNKKQNQQQQQFDDDRQQQGYVYEYDIICVCANIGFAAIVVTEAEVVVEVDSEAAEVAEDLIAVTARMAMTVRKT